MSKQREKGIHRSESMVAYRTPIWWVTLPLRLILLVVVAPFTFIAMPNNRQERRGILRVLWRGYEN